MACNCIFCNILCASAWLVAMGRWARLGVVDFFLSCRERAQRVVGRSPPGLPVSSRDQGKD